MVKKVSWSLGRDVTKLCIFFDINLDFITKVNWQVEISHAIDQMMVNLLTIYLLLTRLLPNIFHVFGFL